MTFFGTLSIIFLGLVPSIAWLAFFLRKDCHPEPKYLLAQTFLLGMIIAPFVISFQLLFPMIFTSGDFGAISQSPSFFMWGAFVEEFFKFLIIWIFIIKSKEFDEPIDAMIYLITAGLGFAAMENILFLFKTLPIGLDATLSVWALRFAGATFLHALAAAITGYFVALAWFFYDHRYRLIALGLGIATLFHFTFNMIVLQSENRPHVLLYSFLLLILFSLLISILFKKIKDRQEIIHLHGAQE